MLPSCSRILAEAIYFLTYSLVYVREPVFLPFLKASSVQKWKKKNCKSEYRAGDITQWFCRAIKLCIISVMIYAAVLVKVLFEIKIIFSLNKVKKSFTGRSGDRK